MPLDGVAYNNAILAYSITLGAWQGIWAFDFNLDGIEYGFRDSARDRTNPAHTLLLYGTIDGFISEQTYPASRQYWELDMASKAVPITSRILSRSFTFSESTNQIQPHSARIQFLESVDPVDICVILDRTIELSKVNTPTSSSLLSLTIPGFPFDLDKEGYYNFPMSLMGAGYCSEVQIELEGEGNWTLYQMKLTAFEAAPLETI